MAFLGGGGGGVTVGPAELCRAGEVAQQVEAFDDLSKPMSGDSQKSVTPYPGNLTFPELPELICKYPYTYPIHN